jgi:tetratricopeptide (TPR) repeat protein
LIAICISAVIYCLPLTAHAAEMTSEINALDVADEKAGIPATESGLDKEIESVRRQIAAMHANTATHTKLGYLLLKKGELNDAMGAFDTALKLNPHNPEALTGRGIVLSRKGEFKKAEQVLKEALILNPDPARAHFELGKVYERLGDYTSAINEFKEGIKKSRQGRK